MHLVNGTGNSPSPGRPTPGVVKQDTSSGDSVDTTKTRSGPRRIRMSSGERPIGAAKDKQSDTEALCQTPARTKVTIAGKTKSTIGKIWSGHLGRQRPRPPPPPTRHATSVWQGNSL